MYHWQPGHLRADSMKISFTDTEITDIGADMDASPLAYGMKSPWIQSGAAGLGITLLFFSLMPVLLDTAGRSEPGELPAAQVNVVRIPRPDTPVNRKEPEPPKPKPLTPRLVPKAAVMKIAFPNLSIPFEINPALDSRPVSFEIPPMAAAGSDFGLPDVFNSGDLDRPLMALTRIQPVYPMGAKQKKIEGYVRVQFIVNVHGSVENVIVIESKPPGVFDQSVINCVSGWRFESGKVDGEPVNSRAETTISFELEQDK